MDVFVITNWIDQLNLHKNNAIGISFKKPLFLLLLLSKMENGSTANQFYFNDIEKELDFLIKHFGNRMGKTRPEQPFHHLNSSPIWNVHVPEYEVINNKKTLPISLLRQKDVYGSFDNQAFELLNRDHAARQMIIQYILEKFWPQTIQDEIRAYFNFSYYSLKHPSKRDAKFAPSVLANYRYRCAMCGFHAHFNHTPFGLDASHIHWHAFQGPSTLENGLALCKLHHWAFDKGVLTINPNYRVHVSEHFVSNDLVSEQYFEKMDGREMQEPKSVLPLQEYLQWHDDNIFIK